jgi:hypothetical protein
MPSKHIDPEEVQYRTGRDIVEMQSQGVDWTAHQFGIQTGLKITVSDVGDQIRLPDIPRCTAIYAAHPDAIGARIVDIHDSYVHLDILNHTGLVVGEVTRSIGEMDGVASRAPTIDF